MPKVSLFSEADNSQILVTVSRRSDVIGYVAIDSTVGGRSCGGLRMLPDIDEAEMRGLAHAMTLKYGFLGLPQG
ncbi:MAG: Glu/Leu/Phe/Val dehydrogenase dimerization domain-containing protein, partial [Thermodesulfobacteriota bacterium]